MSNEQFKFLIHFLNRIAVDERLNTSHISLCFALIICWDQQMHNLPFKITRRLLMEYSKISSISTYHICIKDLVVFGLISYEPSYNSYKGTLVKILTKKESKFFSGRRKLESRVELTTIILNDAA